MCRKLLVIFASFTWASWAISPANADEWEWKQAQFQDVLKKDSKLRGEDIILDGFVRFDRPTGRAFLYETQDALRDRDYKVTIFLQLLPGSAAATRIKDGSRVTVLGYLNVDRHGPLGLYPAEILVSEIRLIPPEMR